MRRSKPSGPRNPPSARASSGGSWKTPEPADVISYSYLWAREAAAGEESGRKDRPAVVVVARIEAAAGPLILVAPVTHSAPEKATDAVEIPTAVKKQLGLDADRSWIVVTELNRFIWPGPDIRPMPETGAPFYDALPDWLFERVRSGVLQHSGRGRLKVTERTT
ncbi:MAG TPA: type II toxin-antitoxin system PemK/MazF family toxin [Allosphingosinicella sp.]